MRTVQETVSIWIKSILGNNIPWNIIDSNFDIEDGMSLKEYWNYEYSEFSRLSDLFNINDNFTVEITNKIHLTDNKTMYFLWIINNLNKLAFKFHLTLNNKNEISSNGYRSQQVLKCTIENNKIKNVKMMIRGKVNVDNIITSQLQLEGIYKTETTHIDGFYLSQFIGEDIESLIGQEIQFHLLYEDGVKTKIKMILEGIDLNHKPYVIDGDKFIVMGNKYPVNLVMYKYNNSIQVIESPRDFSIPIKELKSIIMTDVLDNDWVHTFD